VKSVEVFSGKNLETFPIKRRTRERDCGEVFVPIDGAERELLLILENT